MSEARAILEAEDPKSVFRSAVSIPPPPGDLLKAAVAAKEKYLGSGLSRTSVFTNPVGETFVFGEFDRGNVSTLLFFDRHKREWQPIDQGTFAEAEDPKSIFREITSIPRYTVDPVLKAPGLFDFFIDKKWLGRAKFVNRDAHPQYKYWEVIWMPEHPAHTQPERFKNADEAAQWMLHHRKYTNEAEDPKQFLKSQAKTCDNMARRAGFELLSTVGTTRKYRRQISGFPASWWLEIETATDGTDYWTMKMVGQDNNVLGVTYDGVNALELERKMKYLCVLEAEDPKAFLRQRSEDPQEQVRNVLSRAGFKPTDRSERFERWVRPVPEGASGDEAEIVRFLWQGNWVWDYTVYAGQRTTWTTQAMTPERAVAFIKRSFFNPTTGEPYA